MNQRASPFTAVLPTPFGALGMRVEAQALTTLCFLPPGSLPVEPQDALSEAAWAQLRAYLANPASSFDLPLRPTGTPFQHLVWQAISAIPAGETRSYGEIAAQLGTAARAVGQACGANPLPVLVPCHRVLAASGIGGFAHAREGFLLDAKRWLLHHEARRKT